MKNLSRKNKIIIAGAAAAVVIIIAAALIIKSLIGGGSNGMGGMPSGNGGPQGAPGGKGSGEQQVSYTVVKTETPHTGDVSVTSSLTGTVEASDVVYLYAKASGDVQTVDVSAGDYVEAGQILLTINTDQIAAAKNQMDAAEVSLNSAKSDLSRMTILYNGGDITDQEYESYKSKAESAQLSYESAKINYDKQVSYSQIQAPISGTVESIDVDVYDHVNANAQLAVIGGEGEQRIEAYVSERMMQHLAAGDSVQIFKNGKEYSGKITEVNTMVDSSTGLFKIKAQLETTNEIATGSTVKIVLVTDKAENAMLVPVDAIYYSGGDAYLYVVEDGIAHMRSVEVGLYDDEVAEIKSGLEADDVVVSTWSSNLYEGAHIRLYDELNSDTAENGTDNTGAQAENADLKSGMPQGAAPQKGASAPAADSSGKAAPAENNAAPEGAASDAGQNKQ